MIESRTVYNVSKCSENISITINLPKGCRLDIDTLGKYISELFVEGLLKDLCSGCPFEKSDDSS